MSPLPPEHPSAGSIPATPAAHRRGLNASLSSIEAGLKPLVEIRFSDDTRHFLFRNGQQRRQLWEGHSSIERRAKRLTRALRRARHIARRDGNFFSVRFQGAENRAADFVRKEAPNFATASAQ